MSWKTWTITSSRKKSIGISSSINKKAGSKMGLQGAETLFNIGLEDMPRYRAKVLGTKVLSFVSLHKTGYM
jgi:hypothetical protein